MPTKLAGLRTYLAWQNCTRKEGRSAVRCVREREKEEEEEEAMQDTGRTSGKRSSLRRPDT